MTLLLSAVASMLIVIIYIYLDGKYEKEPKQFMLSTFLLGLSLSILFHITYDFFLFIEFIPGIWIGVFVSLIVGITLSVKAIKIDQKNSHFNNHFFSIKYDNSHILNIIFYII